MKKIFLLCIFLSFFFIPFSQGEDVNIDSKDSLIITGFDTEFNDNGILFTNDYSTHKLSPENVFVPDNISEHATLSGYNVKETFDGKVVEWTGYEYEVGSHYPNDNLNALLGWDDSAESEYPRTYFQLGAYSSGIVDENDDIEDVFGYNFVLDEDGYDVSWVIEVSADYEDLVIDYEMYFENEETSENELVYTFQDVYEKPAPELLMGESYLIKFRDNERSETGWVSRLKTDVDISERNEESVYVTIAYEDDNFGLIKSGGLPSRGYELYDDRYDKVVDKAENLNATTSLIPESQVDNFVFKTYEVEIENENAEELSVKYLVESEEGRKSDFGMWIEGSFYGGSGASDDPYQIYNWNHLDNVRKNMNASYELINDLTPETEGYDTHVRNAGNGWTPIGDWGNPFDGYFDVPYGEEGDYRIDNVIVELSDRETFGLFGKVQGAVKGFKITNAEIYGDGEAGIVAGVCDSGSDIEKMYVDGYVEGTYVGGVVGGLYQNASVETCVSEANVKASDDGGGVVGYFSGHRISRSYSFGKVEVMSFETPRAGGGLVGYVSGNSGSFYRNYSVIDVGDGFENAHGLIGLNEEDGAEPYESVYSGTPTHSSLRKYGHPHSDEELENIETFEQYNWDINQTDKQHPYKEMVGKPFTNHTYGWKMSAEPKPNIESVSKDHYVVDRENDSDVFHSQDSTTIYAKISHPAGAEELQKDNVFFTVRGTNGYFVFECRNPTDVTTVSSDTKKFSIPLNPDSKMVDEVLGGFWIDVKVYDNDGHTDNKTGECMGINDWESTVDYGYPATDAPLEISGDASTASSGTSHQALYLDDVVVDVGDNTYNAKVSGNSWEVEHYVDSSVGESVRIDVHIKGEDGLDGLQKDYFEVQEKSEPTFIGDPDPEYEETNVEVGTDLSVWVEHEAENDMDVGFYWEDGTLIGKDWDVSSHSRASTGWFDLEYENEYNWYAIAWDEKGNKLKSSTYMFETESEPKPSLKLKNISILIKDNLGEGVEGVSVSLSELEKTTSESGFVGFSGIPENEYNVKVSGDEIIDENFNANVAENDTFVFYVNKRSQRVGHDLSNTSFFIIGFFSMIMIGLFLDYLRRNF